MKLDVVRRVVSAILFRIGYNVGCYPQIHIAILFIFSLVLATGILRVSPTKDAEYLYTPSDARSKVDRAAIESMFSINTSQCDYRRLSRAEGMAVIQITSNYETSILEESIIEEVIKLDEIIKNVSFLWNNAFVRYEDLCCKADGNTCHENFVLSLKGKTNDIKKGMYKIKYPADKIDGKLVISGFEFGGVTVDEENVIRGSKAIRLYYPLDHATEETKEMALMWEKTFLETLSKIHMNNIEIYKFVSQSVNDEINRNGESILFLMVIAAPIMLIFSAVSCLSTDALRSKPWLGIAGCVSPFLASVSAFGLLIYSEVEYSTGNVMIIPLILGILRVSPTMDAEYLYVPTDARSKVDRAAIESMFPINTSQCDYRRLSRLEGLALIQVTSKYESSVLEESIIVEVIKLDEIIRNVSFLWNNAFVRYEDLCCKADGSTCHENFVMSLKGKTNDIKQGMYKIKYPADKIDGKLVISGFEFGGVTVDEENVIRGSEAIRLYYPLNHATEDTKEMALMWEKTLLDTLSMIHMNNIEIHEFVSQSVNEEINRNGESILFLMVIAAPIMLIFSAVSCLSTDAL
ncbi:patched domain-containing protein 1-like [Centruroides sculpturatus]|uniref:patched domain-containing protein 1-like n=1 Tax=Centruroides sculpturatus TaxID=218467 RepID=UPI000C6DCF26|nr:patched domain-containing protein 1-like [Centruroides sculpturatus]